MALSQEILSGLAERRRRWEAVGRLTCPADREVVSAAARDLYRAAGLVGPEIVWADGPSDMAQLWQSPHLEAKAGRCVKAEIVGGPVREAERCLAQVLSPADLRRVRREGAAFAFAARSRGVIEAVARAPELGRARIGLLERGINWLLRRPRPGWRYASLVDCGVSPHDAPPFHVFECFADAGLDMRKTSERLDGLMRVVAGCGWFLPFEHTAVLCERHSSLEVDTSGRLHAPAGPALAWPDGFAHYAWKGVPVPRWMIERPEAIELPRIEREPDLALRHCMVDIFTAERFIRRGYAEKVGEDETGILWQHLWRRGGVWAAVEVVNGTPEPDLTRKRYYLQVPGNLRSARQAVAWTYGMTEQEYGRLRRRT
jgi:hypothetical protein